MPILHWLHRNVLNSVPLGIAILISIALYVAVGSGYVPLREWLEMDEMLFFNWWPLKLLVVALILNLSVVTVSRIPLTAPRYGVWTIHMGIILLLLSLSAYYARKIEGYVPLSKGQAASDFYDRWERALYVRTQFGTTRGTVLTGLPRFHEYDETLGNAAYLKRGALTNLSPMMTVIEPGTGQRRRVTLNESLGLDKPVRLDVVGYFPFGKVERWKIDPAATGTALQVRDATAKDGAATWLVAGRAADAVMPVGPAAIEYRHLPTQADVDVATKSAEQLHTLTITLDGTPRVDRVEPGDTIDLAGYSIKVEGFTPGFALSSNDGKKADVLTVLVTRKGDALTTFRRTILSETNVQTDFELGVAGAGPFGKRLRDRLLDDKLQLGYRFSDPTRLLSTVAETTVKYVLFTAGDRPGITMLRVSAREPSVVNRADDQVDLHVTAPPEMFAAASADGHDHTDVAELNVTRVDHVAASSDVVAVPHEKRDRETATTGRGQVVRVRVSCGDWSQIVPVTYDPFATQNNWTTPRVSIPGATTDFQLCLGNQLRPLPVDVRLEKFEAIPYAGGDASGRSVMRDFKSTVTLMPRESADGRPVGEPERTSASMNEPAFFNLPAPVWFVPGESWLFSQASWDPSNLDTTVLQVGNRPAVGTMIAACCMIFAGLMYAFYAKPFVVRRMKQNALRAAAMRKLESKARPTDEKQLVESL